MTDERKETENCVASSVQEQAEPRSSTKAVIEFARWAIRESCWDGCDLDGGSVQDKAEALGLIAAEPYDPEKHGPCEYCPEPGDDWYTFAGPLSLSVEERGLSGSGTESQRSSPNQAVAEDAVVEALRKLDELDAKRTKGPWSQDQTAIHDEDMRAVRIADCSELRMRTERWSHTVASYEQCTINAAFIVALENAWPILRAALKSTAQG